MSTPTQNRPALTETIQQLANLPSAALLALQMQSFTAAGIMGGSKDIAVCDASGGSFAVTLPNSAEVMLGKPYYVEEVEGTNSVTVDAAGLGTINGSTSAVTVPARECVIFMPRSIGATGLVAWDVLAASPAAGGDASAIHGNVSGEIHALTDKPLPELADEIIAETSTAGAWTKIRIAIGNFFKTVGWIDGLTAKTAPTATDTLAVGDAAAAGAPKKSTLQQLFAAIGLIDGLDAKVTPVGADTLAINDSAAGGAAKKIAVSTLLLASNNLSDVASAPTARSSIGANTKNVPMGRLDMIAANAAVLRYVHRGASLTLESIDSSLSAAIDVDADITAAIDGVAVTNGVVSIAAAGSAAGTKDQAVPTAANVLAAGSELTLTIGGGNTLASFADVAVYGTY